MDYYHCPIEELHKEILRRGFTPFGTSDELSESLKRDDDVRGTDATTVKSENPGHFLLQELPSLRTAEFGQTAPAGFLANQSGQQIANDLWQTNNAPEIIYWTMNTFFPTLQLFFESGLSCTIDGGRLPDAVVGLDPKLRFRLTDCTHEEDGQIINTTLPAKFARTGAGLVIREAIIAQRTSMVVKPVEPGDSAQSSKSPRATIVQEVHMVVGLRLDGMEKIAYVWANTKTPSGSGGKSWGDVRVAGLRDDIPVPFLGYNCRAIKPGGRTTVVIKESMIRRNTLEEDIQELLEH